MSARSYTLHCVRPKLSFIAQVMEVRRHNRAERLHKLVPEAFMRLAWQGFISWWEANRSDDIIHLKDMLKCIANLNIGVSQSAYTVLFDKPSCNSMYKLFQVYVKILRAENGSLSTFWMSHVDMVELLLGHLPTPEVTGSCT